MLESILTQRNVKTNTKIAIKSIVTVGIIALAVGLPQLVHLVAGAQGGMIWLPMYLPVLIGGCLLGKWWGLGIGIASPLTSFLITLAGGSPMPTLERLPFMVAELAVFGLVTGLFSKNIAENKWMAFPAVLFAQFAGRLTFLALVAIFQSLLSFNVSMVWSQVQSGLIGLVLQALIVPLIIMALSVLLNKKEKNDRPN